MMKDPFEKMLYNKKSLLALFVTMSKTDDDVDTNEEMFIEEMRERLGVSKEELDHIWENEEDFPLQPPKSEKHRMTIMFHLLYLIAIDGVITQEERDLMHEVGLKLAIKPSLTEDLMDTMEDHLGKDLPKELLTSIIAKYQN